VPIDHPNRIVIVDPVLKAIRKQRRLAAINPFDKTLHQKTPPLNQQDSIKPGDWKKARFYTVWVKSGPQEAYLPMSGVKSKAGKNRCRHSHLERAGQPPSSKHGRPLPGGLGHNQ
jgi:hypothetical protein